MSSTSNFASNFKRFGGCDGADDDVADVDGIVDNTFGICAVAIVDASLGPALSNWRTLLVVISSPLVDAFDLFYMMINNFVYTFFDGFFFFIELFLYGRWATVSFSLFFLFLY